MKHPIQPLIADSNGTVRFKENKIVTYLLDHGGLDMNDLAKYPFDKEDRVQFAQLIGYSLSGFGDLSYVSDDDYDTAQNIYLSMVDERDARIETLTDIVTLLRKELRNPIAQLYGIHPDDLSTD